MFLKEGEVPNTTLKLDGCDYDGLTQLLVKMCEVYKLNIRHGQPYGQLLLILFLMSNIIMVFITSLNLLNRKLSKNLE